MLSTLTLLLCRCASIKLSTGEEVAIKVLHLESVRDELDNIQKEISLLSRLDSVYVVQYRGSFLNGTDLNVVMEFMSGGSLRDLMKAGPLKEDEVSAVLREVLSGLVFLHAANVVHRDIKAANILVNGNGKVKIADFGVARELNAQKRRFSVVGSPYWMAPEVITAKEGGLYNEKADIWSLGITAIELAKGLPPRASEKPMKVLVSIPTSPPPKLEGPFSASFKDFVSQCIKVNPIERPSAKDLLNHPFITQSIDANTLVNILERHKKWLESNPPKSENVDPQNGPTSGAITAVPALSSELGPGVAAVKKSGPFKKTTIDKVKLQTERLEASSVSDSVDDWDLSSGTRTGSPTESARDSESLPSSPRTGEDRLRKLREGKHTPAGAQGRPDGSLSTAVRRPEFSTLSASTDENQFGSVIVHQTGDSDASLRSSSHAQEPLESVDEGAGEEDETSVSMTEQQFGSVVIKSVKKKDPNSNTTSITDLTLLPSVTTTTVTTSTAADKRPKSEKRSNGSGSGSTLAKPKEDGISTSAESKGEKSRSKTEKTETPAPVEQIEAIGSVIRRNSKSSDKTDRPERSSASNSGSSVATPSKDKTDRKKEKEPTTRKKKKVTTVSASTAAPQTATPSDSMAVLNQVILPTLTKKVGCSPEKIAQLVTSFNSLESESPGFSADFLVGLLQKLEKEQRSLPSIASQLALSSSREDFSDLTKYLLQRWKNRPEASPASAPVSPTLTPYSNANTSAANANVRAPSSDDSYFL